MKEIGLRIILLHRATGQNRGDGAGAWLLPIDRLTTTAYRLRVRPQSCAVV